MLRSRPLPVAVIASLTLLSSCASADATADEPTTTVATADTATDAARGATTDTTPDTTGTATTDAAVADEPTSGGVGGLTSAVVHTIDVEIDPDEYAAMLTTYTTSDDKEWIGATVTIDGRTFEQVGMRLKGNSSLRGVSADADPTTLPWLIKLDKFVDDQSLDGLTDLVVRSNATETALNEAVALELLELAGLASQDAIATEFTVNGGDASLRLVIDHPDDEWMSEVFDADGALYKAESTGDYSYRGDDPSAYDEVFDQEAGDENTDLTPLIELLAFLDESDDATFASELERWLDVDAFATYLAMQDLVVNFDDIDGPGNNSYLYWDAETGRFTVVPWDHNLAFGARMDPGEGGPGNGFPGGDAVDDGPMFVPRDGDAGTVVRPMPPDGQFPTEGQFPTGGPGGGMAGRANVLVERFLAVPAWADLVETRTAELRTDLYGSGVADRVLESWAAIVASSGLTDEATIDAESSQIAAIIAG
jgi:spore coat protein CotH